MGPPQAHLDADDGGDDLARLLDDDGVPDADVAARDLVLVVEGSAGDGGAGEGDGLQLGDGRQDACAPHLDGDVPEARPRLLGRELVGLRPTGRTGRHAQRLALREVVDLDDRAVRVVGEAAAQAIQLLDGGEDAVQVVRHAQPRLRPQPQPPERRKQLPLARHRDALHLALRVEQHVQRTLRHHARVERLQAPRRRIPRVRERLLAVGDADVVQLGEARTAHEHLAARLEHLRNAPLQRLQAQRHRRNGADVRRHVVALLPVAAREGADQHAALVAQRDADAIDLGFDDVGDVLSGESVGDVGGEALEVAAAVGVV